MIFTKWSINRLLYYRHYNWQRTVVANPVDIYRPLALMIVLSWTLGRLCTCSSSSDINFCLITGCRRPPILNDFLCHSGRMQVFCHHCAPCSIECAHFNCFYSHIAVFAHLNLLLTSRRFWSSNSCLVNFIDVGVHLTFIYV